MTRGQIRTLLRRHIQDTQSVQWTDNSELDDIINLAYGMVQKEIVKAVGPEEHLFWDRMDATAGTSWYPLPQSFGIAHVGIKTSTSATQYTFVKPKRYRDIMELTGTTHYYTRRGQWLGIFPAPATTVTNGIELLHCPILSIGSGPSNDGEVPKIKTPLHLAIVYWARLIALGDTDEQSGETRDRLQEIISDIPHWYSAQGDEPDRIQVDF